MFSNEFFRDVPNVSIQSQVLPIDVSVSINKVLYSGRDRRKTKPLKIRARTRIHVPLRIAIKTERS